MQGVKNPDSPYPVGPFPKKFGVESTYLYPTDMDEFKSSKERIGYSYATLDQLLNYYNISRMPDVDNSAEPYIAYILMSRPDLNITSGGGGIWGKNTGTETSRANLETIKNMAMTSAYANDKHGELMMHQLSRANNNIWLPIITTRAKNYNVTDAELKYYDKGLTFYGHKITYGKHSEDYKVGGTISIEFRNDRYLSIMKMMQIWMSYIYNVSKNDYIVPDENYQRNAILDYAGSIYYLVCRRDGRELVYWEKLVGVFPTRVPYSIFSTSDQMIMEDTLSIDFAYSIRSDPCDPSVLIDINFLSGDQFATIQNKTMYGYSSMINGASNLENEQWINNKETPFVKGDVWATNPYIVRQNDNGNLKYYLTWENKDSFSMNQSDTYNEVYQDLISTGVSEDTAKNMLNKTQNRYWKKIQDIKNKRKNNKGGGGSSISGSFGYRPRGSGTSGKF